MRTLFCTIIFILSALVLRAQAPYGNEWINYSQKYYKIKIYQDGIYRIDAATLNKEGIPINTIDPRNIQIFGRGEEIPLYVEGESDGVFNAGDYIEFYAQRNDGYFDSSLYINTPFLPNPYYSLFNDTATYFLTWNSSANNKRMGLENDFNFTSYTPDAYFFKEEIQYYPNTYYGGETDAVGGTDAQYTQAEGWFDNEFDLNTSKTYSNINTQNAYNSGPNALIKTVVVGASRSGAGEDHHLTIEYKNVSGNWQLLTDTFFAGYKLNRFTYSITPSQLGNTPEFKYSSILEIGYPSNRTAVSYIYIKYPHTFDLEGSSSFKLFVPDNSFKSKSFLKINNFDAPETAYLYDLTNHKRIKVIKNGSELDALVPNSGAEKLCYLIAENQIAYINSLQPVTSTALFTDFSANAPDSAYIIITHKNLWTEATKYKTYRNSIPGGAHAVTLADVDELYDQFAYGISKHPLAIRNFAAFALANFPTPPKNLFLIGKSIHAADYRKKNSNFSITLVPSIGNPSCDNLFTAGLNGTFLQPAIPTGRLSARTPSDVSLYLNKVKEYESNPAEEWMKNVLHFGGGTTAYEQSSYANYLNTYKNTIEDTSYGGKVKTFLKTSSAPIQINQSDSLKQLIETGVSLMTFFGHASGTGFDQSIDDPASYNNREKYPFVLANSCFAGDLHTTGISSSEAFVLIANKGMIGQLASVSQGIPYALDLYSSNFYRNLSQRMYGRSVGENIQDVIGRIQNNAVKDPYVKSVCLEMTLHGDPAIIINSHSKPDYTIANSDVYFDMTSQVDSITVYAIVTNIGKSIHDSLIIQLERKLPNGNTVDYWRRIAAPIFKDTISFKIPVDFANGIGLNKIKITLDFYDEIEELSETNNSTIPDVNILIQGVDIIPVYPYKYAIIPNNTVTLKASTSDAFAPTRNCIFEIDTTDAFIAPLASTKINSSGGIVQWTLPLTLKDSVVYYWRVGIDSVDATGHHWRESSFQYINGKRGWGQAHFFQFKNDSYQYVKYNKPQRKFDFFNDIQALSVRTWSFVKENDETSYRLNNSLEHHYTCTPNGFSFAIIDPISAIPLQSVLQGPPNQGANGRGQYGNVHCVNRLLNAFDFYSSNVSWRSKIENFVDSIPDGYYVLAYSQGNTSIQMDTTLYQAFEKLGSGKIRTLQNNIPYILWGKKGAAIGTAAEVIGNSTQDVIQYNGAFSTKWNEGFIASEIIGPALNWGSLHWKSHSEEINSTDSIMLRLIGIRYDGTEIILANFPKDSADVYDLASYADASLYPYLKMIAYMKDNAKRTPPQIDRWQVIYSPLPELTVNPRLGYSFYKDTLQEGTDIKLTLAVENISELDFTDSLLITYWIQDKDRNIHDLPFKLRKPPFKGGTFFIDTITANTIGYTGLNSLWVEVNPVNQPHSQLEQYHFNNIARVEFYIGRDNINPILDVTFDGIHILNGDIVSARPNVLIQLKDENNFLALNDTSDFAIFLKKPASSTAERIYFGNEMGFTPAVLPNNSCKINYTPILPQDGTYQLIVQAKDRSDNLSGSIDYKVNFEIVNKSTITEVFNYPNPFSSATRFVFTLTGSELPGYFKIQILSVTGKVVREITKDELGYMHIGRNITEYAWDGKDEFGDQLANGVYLYKVITQLNGSSIEKRGTSADKYFTQGFGKMYLIR